MKVSDVSDKEAREFWMLVLKEYAKPGKKKVIGELVDFMFSLKKDNEDYSESDKKAIAKKAEAYITEEGIEDLDELWAMGKN